MRMVHAVQENVSEGAQQVKQTGIGGDAKIVYALLTGMVSDKVVYPVRETATNAWEVSPAGKPAEIELPTRFNLQFKIRDFGPGLSHRFMMDRYAKIGESTKDDDDQAVGGWGFGSKSPLAYLMRSDGAGSFTVVSRFRGFRRVYSIGVGTTGKIEISFLGEWPLEPEDRGTGLEVTFPVRPDDIHRFHDHAKAVYWSFEPRPKVTPEIDFGTPRILHRGDGWTVYSSDTVPFAGPQVRLGPVMYPVNWALAPRASSLLQSNTAIVFDARIGSISVSASREALQYDDRTEAGLRALFEHYDQDWLAKARVAVDAEPTYFKARARAWRIADSLGNAGWRHISQIGWRGFDFNDDLFPMDGRAKACCWPEADEVRRRQSTAAMLPLVFKADWQVNPGELDGRTVVIQHASSRSLERFEAAGLLDTPCVWVRVKRVDKDWALARMGNPAHIILDDIKLPPRPKGSREKRPESVKRRRFLERSGVRTTSKLVDLDDELLYIKVEGRGRNREIETRVDGARRVFSPSRYTSILMDATELGLIDDSLDVLVLDEYEQPLDHWRSLGDHLSELIDAAIDPTQVAPVIPWGDSSFPQQLLNLRDYGVGLGVAPQALRDVYYDMIAMLKTREKLDRVPNEHDKLAALNLRLTGTDIKSVAKDPTQPIRDRFTVIADGMPLLSDLVIHNKRYDYSNGYSVTEDGQRKIDHYFQLLAK